MPELSEADRYLLEQVRRGDPAGWSAFVDRYQGRLLAFARQKLRQRADAEDLVQDTFINFLKALPSFREEASLETYLFTILRRKVIDAFRGRRVNVCLLQDVLAASSDESSSPASYDAPASDPTASQYARRREEHAEQSDALTAAIRELIESHKESRNFRDLQIVEMLFYCQLRNKEAAEIVGLNEKQVALIKHRCIQRVRERIARLAPQAQTEPPDYLLTQIWQNSRLSCLKRSTLGAYLLGTLESDWQGYVIFHLERLGCQFCKANLDDLREKAASGERQSLRSRIMESTVGFLSSS